MLFKLHKLKCDNGHYTNAVVAEGETLEENLKKDVIFSITIFVSDFYENGTSEDRSENS